MRGSTAELSLQARAESEDNIYMAVDSVEAMLSRKLRKAKDQWTDKGRKKRGTKSNDDMEVETLKSLL